MKKKDKWYTPTYVKIGVTILIVIFMLFLVSMFTQERGGTTIDNNKNTGVQTTLEEARANLIKASLNVYYTSIGSYPFSTEEFLNYLESRDDEGLLTKEALQQLKDLKYSRRGDRQAYKITYTSVNGNEFSFEGNYKEDYH